MLIAGSMQASQWNWLGQVQLARIGISISQQESKAGKSVAHIGIIRRTLYCRPSAAGRSEGGCQRAGLWG